MFKRILVWIYKITLGGGYILRDIFMNGIAGSYVCPRFVRTFVYRGFGNQIKTYQISPRCFLGGSNLSVGENTFINYGNFFDLTAGIIIGSNVRIGPKSVFITGSHEIGDSIKRAGERKQASIVIEDGCWIGAGVTVLPPVTIKHGSVVAAGAVVTEDCESDTLYGGVPARILRRFPAKELKEF